MNSSIDLMLQQAVHAFQNGNFIGAETLLKQIIRMHPKNLPALQILGLIKAMQEKHSEAATYLKKAVQLNPEDPALQYNLAKALFESGANKDALLHHKKAIELAPNNGEAWLNYGKNLSQLEKHHEALSAYDSALAINPNHAEAILNKGAALKELKRPEEALTYAEKALSLNNQLVEAWSNRGSAYKELKNYKDALSSYEQAIALKPDFAEAWYSKGALQGEFKLFEEALTSFEKAILLKPDHADAWYNKGVALNELYRYQEGVNAIAQAYALKPELNYALGMLIQTKLITGRWSDLKKEINSLIQKIKSGKKAVTPFSLLPISDSPALQLEAAKIWTQDQFSSCQRLPKISHKAHDRIRIGYFSSDLRIHPVSFLTAELYESHDRNHFEIFAFSLEAAKPDDEMRNRLIKAFDHFIDVEKKSSLEIAQLARAMEIDIAIDLNGHTRGARTEIFAHGAAPVQINYLGYPGTMGADFIDYIIADKAVIPESHQKFYTEKIIYLPNSFQVNDSKRPISERKFTREELGLPENGFIFCCFNNNYKVNPEMLSSWMRILSKTTETYLWLLAESPASQENFIAEAHRNNIDPARLIFGKRLPPAEYLARYRYANLFLDTLPFNAGTTASDALWGGLPVLTQAGESFSGRMASSLLNAVGLPELVTNNQAEYESLAIELASNPEKLSAIRDRLAGNLKTYPLFNTKLFTRNLERAYTQIYENYRANLKLENIEIFDQQ